MELLLFHVEIAALAGVIVGLYALRGRLGLTPVYLAAGVLMGFMVIGARIRVPAPVFGEASARYVSMGYLPLLMATIALIYTLEGTRQARRFLGGLVLTKVFVNVLKALIAWRLVDSGVDLEVYGRERWLRVGIRSSVVSTFAILSASVAMVIVYQASLNLARRLRLKLLFLPPLTIAVVVAMLVDGAVYAALTGRLHKIDSYVVGKFSTGFAIAIPMATYIAAQLRAAPKAKRTGVLERSALELVTLKRQLEDARDALTRSQARFAQLKDTFGRYVVPDVVEELLANEAELKLGGEVREVSVLFADIRNYSTLSEQMSPTEVIELLNRYFAAMSEVIDRERGSIIEFEGDSILTVFGAPLMQPDHAARAVRTAERMLAKVDELNRTWEEDGTAQHWQRLSISDFRIRVGVHTGPVVVGNVGSETRTKYAVIGDTVNTAARVEQLNKALRTWGLITQPTYEAAGEFADGWVLIGPREVRGRREPVTVYQWQDPAEIDETAALPESSV